MIPSVLKLLSWPVVILVSWFAIWFLLKFYEKSQEKAARKRKKEL